jgi:aminoglycoside 6'-N-acetyltransferase
MTAPEVRGERVTLRPLAPDDVPWLVELGREPEVARWWPDITPEVLLAETEDDTLPFAVELEGELIGYAQAWEETDPQYRHAGIDLFLSPAFQGRGLGTDTVRTLARHLVRDRGHHRVTIDPRADNERAIRCYERVGFKRVGIQRRHELGPDGVWHDGLLLDLLADEID